MYHHPRSTQKRIILPILSVALSSFLLASCSSNNDDENQTIAVIDTEQLVAETLYTVQVTDAEGSPVDATVTVVGGSDDNDIIPEDQESQSAVASRGSLVTFEPTELSNDEETIYVTAAADNYLSNTVPVTIIKGDSGNKKIVINAIPEVGETSTVSGIGATSVEAINIDNAPIVVTAETTSESSDPEETTVTTSVTIPQAVQATDAQGVALSNNLSVVVAQFDPDESTALQAFPGGFSANVTNANEIDAPSNDDSNGEIQSSGDLIFQSVGFTAIEVKDDEGRLAKDFDPGTPVTVKTEIQPDTKHPTATPERNIQAGDKVPLWSYESSTGQWTYEREVTVQEDENSKLYTEYEVTHLSWYNLDYFESGSCTSVLNINDANGQPFSEPLSGELVGPGWSHQIEYLGDGTINLQNAPSSFDVTLKLFTSDGSPAITFPSGNFNLCEPSENTIGVVPTGVSASSEFTVNASSYCKNDDTAEAKPVEDLTVSIYTTNWVNLGSTYTDSDGSASFNLRDGEYLVYFWNWSLGHFESEVVTASSTDLGNNVFDISIPQECEEVPTTTGGSTTTGG